ncbi:MAG: carboxypeptidase-like regulatory domain-containing protein [Aureispira sp.]
MKLSINNPCHESWATMQPTEQGRFCTACQKEVLDFTNVPFSTLKHFFEAEKGAVCGRVYKHQLETFNSFYQPLPTPSRIKQWTAAAVLTAVVTLPSFGQSTPATPTVHLTEQVAPKQHRSTTLQSDLKPQKTVILSGKVYHTELKELMPFTSIWVLETEIGTNTDVDGNFKLEVPYSDKPIKLKISHFGYEPIIHSIVPNQSRAQLLIEMKGYPHELISSGIMIVEPTSKKEEKAIKKEAKRQIKRKEKANQKTK